MKSSMKRLLRKELPYPEITIRADRRIDDILAALPEKNGAAFQKGASGEWEDLSRENWVREEPVKRRFGGTAAKWVLVCAAVVLVGLAAFDIAAPAAAEGLPVLGNVFRAVNGLFRGEEQDHSVPPQPSPSPDVFQDLPVEDNGTTLLKAEFVAVETDGGEETLLECTAKLPYLGDESWNLLEYDGGCTRPEGREATIHFPNGEWSFSSFSHVETERGGAPTVTWQFYVAPEHMDGQVVIAIPERNLYVMDEESSSRRIVAEFTLDLSPYKVISVNSYAPKAAVTKHYETGYFGGTMPTNKVTPEEALSTPRNGEFTQDWYAQRPFVVPGGSRKDGGSESGHKVVFFQRNISTEGLDPYTGNGRREDWDTVTLNYYLDGEWKGSVSACSQEELNKSDMLITASYEAFADESFVNSPGIHTRSGSFLDMLADPEAANGDYRRLVFFIPASAWGLPDDEYFRFQRAHSFHFELVDSEGNVIFSDVGDAAEAEYEQMIEAYHKLCRVENPNATAEQVACSPLPVEDNGTTLTKIERDGSAVTVTAQVPYMGRVRDSLDTKDYYDYTLFGTEAYLSRFGEYTQRVDSTEVEGEGMEGVDGRLVLMQSHPVPDRQGEFHNVTWTFQNVKLPEDGQMVLTLYERPAASEGELNHPNRITAEFVLDLNTGEAAPADYAEVMGRAKPTVEEVCNTPRTAAFAEYKPRTTAFYEGWYPAGMEYPTVDGVEYCKAVFYQENVDTRSVRDEYYVHPDWEPATLKVYLDGELKTEITACPREDLEASGQEFTVGDGAFLDEMIGNFKYYQLENGMFYDEASSFSNHSYRRLAFGVPASALGLENGEMAKLADRLRFAFDCSGKEVFFDAADTYYYNRGCAEEIYAAFCQVDEPGTSRERAVMESNCTYTDGKNPALCLTPNLDASQYSCYIQLFVNTVEDLDDWELYVEQADGTAATFPLGPGDTSVQPPETGFDEEDMEEMWHPVSSGPMYRLDWRAPTADEYEKWVTANLWKGLDLPRRCYMLTLYQNGGDGKTYDWNDAIWRLQTTREDPRIIIDHYGDWRPSDGPFVLNGASPPKA